MTKLLYISLAIVSLVLSMTNMAFAGNISLAWDANPELDIAGYRVYYQADSAALPLEGFEAIEGDSPIDVGNASSLSLTGLPDGRVYYVAVSAYNAAGTESALSNIVASDWVPEPIAPTNGALDESTVETFIWGPAPQGYDVTYTLYYGTDPEFKAATILAPPNLPRIKLQPLSILSVLILFGLFVTIGKSTKRTFATGALVLTLGLAMTGCGGDGGGLSSIVVPGGDTTIAPPELPVEGGPTTSILFKGNTDYHEAYDLEPSTTYYWKVVAVDTTNPNLRYESPTNSFTTAVN